MKKDVKLMSDLPYDNPEEADDMFSDLQKSIGTRQRQIRAIETQLHSNENILTFKSVKSQKEIVQMISRMNLSTDIRPPAITKGGKHISLLITSVQKF